MTQILTESFCERCGTRYTFETVAPRRGGVTQLKVLSKGIRNFVMSDGTTIEDAFADAKSDVDRVASTHQLEAFHKTFNFCLDCRQYTCGNCWNETENRCLSCKPDLSREPLPAPFPDLAPVEPLAAAPESEDRAALLAAMSWPETDLRARSSVAAAAEAEAGAAAEAEAIEAAELPEAAAPEPEATAAAPAPVEVDELAAAASALASAAAVVETAAPAPGDAVAGVETPADGAPVAAEPDADGRVAAATAATAALLGRYRPGQSLDDEIAAYEREVGSEPEPVAATGGEAAAVAAEAMVETETAPAAAPGDAAEAATVGAEIEVAVDAPAAAEPEVAPVGAEVEAAPPAVDLVEQPVWVRTPPAAPAEAPAPPPPATAPPAPQWPTPTAGEAPQWPSSAAFLPVADPTVSRVRDAMWAASNVEVAQPPTGAARAAGVQSCPSCGLSLSATARFCRRCGTRQG